MIPELDLDARMASLEAAVHTYFQRALDYRGSLRPVTGYTEDEMISIRCSYALTEHTNVLMAVAGSHFTGDYFEFGCLTLASFVAFINCCRINEGAIHPNGDPGSKKTFYGFDVFGDYTPQSAAPTHDQQEYFQGLIQPNIEAEFQRNPELDKYYDKIKRNGLYVENCRLVKGFFQETFTPEWVAEYCKGERRAGFVNIDCDRPASHQAVFDNLAGILSDNAWIYLREGLEPPNFALFETFREKLATERNLRAVLIRTAGNGGTLWRCYPRG